MSGGESYFRVDFVEGDEPTKLYFQFDSSPLISVDYTTTIPPNTANWTQLTSGQFSSVREISVGSPSPPVLFRVTSGPCLNVQFSGQRGTNEYISYGIKSIKPCGGNGDTTTGNFDLKDVFGTYAISMFELYAPHHDSPRNTANDDLPPRLGQWTTVIGADSMFSGSKIASLGSLEEDFLVPNESDLISLATMFSKSSLQGKIELSTFKGPNIEAMSGMFSGCLALQGVTLRSMTFESVNNLSRLFDGCSELKFAQFLSPDNVLSTRPSPNPNMEFMFRFCPQLQSVTLMTRVAAEKVHAAYVTRSGPGAVWKPSSVIEIFRIEPSSLQHDGTPGNKLTVTDADIVLRRLSTGVLKTMDTRHLWNPLMLPVRFDLPSLYALYAWIGVPGGVQMPANVSYTEDTITGTIVVTGNCEQYSLVRVRATANDGTVEDFYTQSDTTAFSVEIPSQLYPLQTTFFTVAVANLKGTSFTPPPAPVLSSASMVASDIIISGFAEPGSTVSVVASPSTTVVADSMDGSFTLTIPSTEATTTSQIFQIAATNNAGQGPTVDVPYVVMVHDVVKIDDVTPSPQITQHQKRKVLRIIAAMLFILMVAIFYYYLFVK